MRQDNKILPSDSEAAMLATTWQGLSPLARDIRKLGQALDHLKRAGDNFHEGQIDTLRRTLREFEPSVTLIGQVKAGKTSLVNALAGGRDLLPSDINPWTSVVTSLHQSPILTGANERASFSFFSEDEWTSLLRSGGRVGELASRAGADSELEKVRQQLDEMRQASRQRLGDRFEMLLGQTHDYRYVDAELVQRYVCLGDATDQGEPADQKQGRFADITRSADIFVSRPSLPVPVCLRDTPGVNDTFMVREQITLKAIRGSRLCVVVLSAHQALSNVDLALVRMIANVPARDLIIFINRVDDLTDPAQEIPEIERSVRATLARYNVSEDAQLLFGSAKWALAAASGNLNQMGQASAEALLNWARYQALHGTLDKDPLGMVWALSGLPALGAAISDRVIAGEGAEVIAGVASGARNAIGAIAASRAIAEKRVMEGQLAQVDGAATIATVDQITADADARFAADLDHVLKGLDLRLQKAQDSFGARATDALIEHLETVGEDVEWTYDPTGLRLLLESGYNVFTAKAQKLAEDTYLRNATATRQLFLDKFGLSDVGFDLEPPAVPPPPVPVMLGQTIALDIKGSWWTRWWRRKRSYIAYADEFRALIDAEIAPVLTALREDHAEGHVQALRDILTRFTTEQRDVIVGLAGQDRSDLNRLRRETAEIADAKAEELDSARAQLASIGTGDILRDRT
ncbi:dynamin family protein [Jannaschia sp. CCS1]|uniref:dynamin family protein n=1 Tax=Jannaschia sp. (strain CCS1) TaxID=290400 RepID=UPI000053C800|nr:dynamin family protein [Jannaschia sp. CCS1]ABD57062.1 hypothetical protein Jann_4145 [Jannaschia sp. CCS1]